MTVTLAVPYLHSTQVNFCIFFWKIKNFNCHNFSKFKIFQHFPKFCRNQWWRSWVWLPPQFWPKIQKIGRYVWRGTRFWRRDGATSSASPIAIGVVVLGNFEFPAKNCLTVLAENLSCLVLTKKRKTRSHLFVCFLNPHCYIFTMCDLTEIIIATTFLFYTKKNTIQLVKDLKLQKKNLLPSQIYRAVKMVGNVSFKWLVLNLAFLNPLPCLFLEERKKKS